MNASSQRHATVAGDSSKGKVVGRGTAQQDQELSDLRADLRDAIDESRWKHDALAEAMSLACGNRIDGPYLSKLLSGEKSLSAAHLSALPDDIETIFHRKRAERFGHLVVKPLSGLDAQKAFVAGLIGIMSKPELPVRAEAMVKAPSTTTLKVAARA
ncbi:MAG TPA: hypothetical protein VFA59_17990 [Vicinamibacterales bacterium]|nr:hypothetical protein [Vicinamibacterales bacterium]